MDKLDFSEDTTSKQQEDLPYDGAFSQIKLYNDYNFTSKNDILDISNQIPLTADDPQEKATYQETSRNVDMATTLGKMAKTIINKNYDKEKQSTTNLDIPANERDPSKSNISDVLLHHLSNEEFLKGQGINCETLPEISNTDSSDDAIIKNIILRHVKNSWLQEQTPELTDQLSPQRGENSNMPCCSLTVTEENAFDLEVPGESSHQETSSFLTEIKSLHDKPKSCQGQPPQKLQTEKAVSGNGFKHGHGLVHYQLPDLPKVVPKGKIPKNKTINKPLTIDKQVNFSPKLREKSAIVQDILESISRSNCIERQGQKRKTADPSQQPEMEPTVHTHQEHLPGIESERSLFKLSSISQRDHSPSSSYIFQKITQGKQMCQKLKEQTDQLKTKVQEFSKSIAQDSPYHLQDKRLVLEKLQGHLELLEQEFLDNKEKHLTLKQVHRHESPAVGDFDPEREVEDEIFKLEMLLEDVKEKINKGKYTSAVSLPVSSPIIPDDLASTSSPPSNETKSTEVTWQLVRSCYDVTVVLTSEGVVQVSCPHCWWLRNSYNVCAKQFGNRFLNVWGRREAEPVLKPSLFKPQAATAQTPTSEKPEKSERRSPEEENPNTTSGRQDPAETTSASCAFCHRVCEWKENTEKKGHRRTNCGRCPPAIQEKALLADSILSSDAGPSCSSASGTGLQSNKCENCGTKSHNSRRVCGKKPLEEFHYRYNMPGENYLNPNERSAFVKLCFLNENKNSSPSCSEPEWNCSQTSNPKSSHDEHEPIPGKKNLKVFMTYNSDLATPSPHCHFCRISGSKSLSNFGSMEETESEILNSSLDHALRTASILKETTDRMIRTIAEDLAKVQRWRNRLKY
ncbi:protein AKNAD1 [Ursus americanus]|uniref:protein AKNAD1 n=1 Tax=Ursus americanus TaxID=9643 RepID=UPI001E67D8A8|nr:protein AKNAD1 [Ursus americanus]